jgi:hypothetical protein
MPMMTALQTRSPHGRGIAAGQCETAFIRRVPPQPRPRTLSGRPSCRIYRGRRAWLLEFEGAWGGWMEPWTGANGSGRKTLAFATLADAVGYAERHGYDYRIEPPTRPRKHAGRDQRLPKSWLARLSANARNGDIYHG